MNRFIGKESIHIQSLLHLNRFIGDESIQNREKFLRYPFCFCVIPLYIISALLNRGGGQFAAHGVRWNGCANIRERKKMRLTTTERLRCPRAARWAETVMRDERLRMGRWWEWAGEWERERERESVEEREREMRTTELNRLCEIKIWIDSWTTWIDSRKDRFRIPMSGLPEKIRNESIQRWEIDSLMNRFIVSESIHQVLIMNRFIGIESIHQVRNILPEDRKSVV